MKFSKLIPLAFAALMAAGGLSGCSTDGGGSGDKLIIWANPDEENVVKALVESYNASAADEDKVSYDYIAIGEDDAGTQVANNPTAADAPELYLVADDQIYNLQDKGAALRITGDYEKNIKKNITSNAVAGATYDNKLWGFPVTNDNGFFLYYNSTMIRDSEVNTLEDLLKAAEKAGKKVLFDVGNGFYAATFFLSPEVNGVDSLKWRENSDGDVIYDIGWKNDKSVKAFEAARALFQTYGDTIQAATNTSVVADLQSGTACAAIFGTWVFNAISNALGNNLKATKLPTFKVESTNCQMASFTGSKVYCVNAAKTGANADTKKIKAVKLAAYMTSKEGQLKRFEVRGTAPCDKEAQKDSSYTKNKTIAIKALEAQNAAGAAIQSVAAESRYWNVGKAIGQAIKDGKLGGKTVKQFLTDQCKILENPAV